MIWKAWRNETIAVLAVFMTLAGLVTGHALILMAGLFFWGLTWMAAWLAQRTLASLSITAQMTERVVEPGQPIDTELVVTNPLPWPILDVQWKIDVPRELRHMGAGKALEQPGGGRQTVVGTLWVGGRQRVRIKFQLTGQTRGRWNVGPASLMFKDPLSWNELLREDQSLYYLTVWPRRLDLPRSFWSSLQILGEVRGQPWDMPDPLRVVGVRAYHPGDPVRHIAPYASARLGELMVKVPEPVQDRAVEILVHPKTTEAHWHGIDRELLEDTISIAASVAESATHAGFATGLAASGSVPGHVHGMTLLPEVRADAADLLTALAWMQPSGTMDDDLPHVVARMSPRLRRGTLLVVVSPYWPEDLTTILDPMARHGLQVVFLTLGDETPSLPTWVRHHWHYQEGRWSHG